MTAFGQIHLSIEVNENDPSTKHLTVSLPQKLDVRNIYRLFCDCTMSKIISFDDGAESVASSAKEHGVADNSTGMERQTLARKEDVAVQWMQGAVFLVLLTTAILVSTSVYIATHNDQINDFEHAFNADATKVIETFNQAIERRLTSIDALSLSITAFARDTGATFPNVTISDFETRCANTRVLSGSPGVHYFPVVTDETRKGWEAYQIANRDQNYDVAFASETKLMKQQDTELGHPVNRQLQQTSTPNINDEISNIAANLSMVPAPVGSGPYLPIWQMSPVLPFKTLLNLNMLMHPINFGSYNEVLRTGKAAVGAVTNLKGGNVGDSDVVWQTMVSMGQYRYDIAEYLTDPVSFFGYPIFDSFDKANRTVVGVLATSMYWNQYFKNILPGDTIGIVCVLRNNRNQTFSYRIDGTATHYLGEGDLHDSQYNSLGQSSSMASYLEKIQSPETKSYTSVDLSTEYCNYELSIYPSQEYKAVHVTRTPMLMTLAIACVFLFSSFIFVMYTIAVRRRQEVVMSRAVASSSIVSSLFPSQVRDQIYQESADAQNATGKSQWHVRDKPPTGDSDNGAASARPIAQLFDNTTIMFADMAGFTLWSSTRTPVQVFELLETVYKAFDAIAVRRNVFKVETIGDCYVAVAGLPDPQADHAVIMIKFASDCIFKMGQLTTELAHVLGADTAGLALRVGLHSGSVTGGVLRGQKSRFQLFGDTMNTASRMESNGEPGRIHISEQTANELAAKGKSSWVTHRKDKIVAKGKGELQTYWASLHALAESVESMVKYSSDGLNEVGNAMDGGKAEAIEI
jgi:class 3 adenylate cyclase